MAPRPAQHDCSNQHAGARRALTLVEVLLTLVLLVVIGSMTAPVFFGAYATARLRSGGDLVVSQWSDARTRAIETGEVYQFRFTPESGKFVVEPWSGALGDAAGGKRSSSTASSASAPAAPTAASGAAVVPSNSSNVAGAPSARNGTLPEEVVFQKGELAVEDPLTGERSVGSLQESSGDDLSTPILFFPDGTTSQASVTLTNGKKQFVRVTLRGLTGVGRASAVLTEDELQRVDRRK